MKTNQGVSPTIVNFPAEFKEALVQKARERGQTIKDFMIEAITKELNS